MYHVALLSLMAFVGTVGATYALILGRRRLALAFGIIGFAAFAIALALAFTSL